MAPFFSVDGLRCRRCRCRRRRCRSVRASRRRSGRTGVYEFGDPGFGKERAYSIDAALRTRSGPHSGSVGVYHTRFRNFITEFLTGNTRGADGEINPPDAGDGTSANTGEAILPEVAFRATPAIFRGVEAQGRFRVAQRHGTLDVELRGDYTRAYDADTGQPLPRIAPLRFGGGLIYALDRIGARIDVTRVQGQDRVSANELPTDGYTMLNAEARNHVSFLKDIAPLPGRGIMVGVRGSF